MEEKEEFLAQRPRRDALLTYPLLSLFYRPAFVHPYTALTLGHAISQRTIIFYANLLTLSVSLIREMEAIPLNRARGTCYNGGRSLSWIAMKRIMQESMIMKFY
jgi:hypothetical protein